MVLIAQTLETAVEHHRAGRLPQAEQWYRQVLQDEPENAEAHHLLGLLAHHKGQNELAVQYISQALRLQPELAQAHSDLGMVLASQGNLEKAVACYRRALRYRPGHAEAHHNLANAFRKQGKLRKAVTCYRQALRCKPDLAQTHCSLGAVLYEQKRLKESMTCYRRALALNPNLADAHSNLGVSLLSLGKLPEAAACFQQALRLHPAHAQAYCNLGVVLSEQGRLHEAAIHFQRAIQLDDSFADAHVNLSYIWFYLGDYEAGWPEYEWRWKRPGLSLRTSGPPLWDGSSLQGRTILLFAEQGFGDTLQFVRDAPLVQQQGGTVIVECQPQLARLLTTCVGIDHVVPQGTPLPPFDFYLPLLSLPRVFGTTLPTLKTTPGYLSPDPALCTAWKETLQGVAGFKVGIVWQGNPDQSRDRVRSAPLKVFEPLTTVPGVRLVSLQKGPGRKQLRRLADRSQVLDMTERLEDFADTAALVSQLDLVITVDTAVAHLAGALGIPAWVLLAKLPDWRWGLEGEFCAWYPTLRLFRQHDFGDWPGVLARVADALRKHIEARQ